MVSNQISDEVSNLLLKKLKRQIGVSRMFENIKRVIDDFRILGSRKYSFLRKNQIPEEDICAMSHLLGYWLYEIASNAVAITAIVVPFLTVCAMLLWTVHRIQILIDILSGELIWAYNLVSILNLLAHLGMAATALSWMKRVIYDMVIRHTEGMKFSFETFLFLDKVRDLEYLIMEDVSHYTKPIYQVHGYGPLSGQCPVPLTDRTERLILKSIEDALRTEVLKNSGYQVDNDIAQLKRQAKKLVELALELGIIEGKTLDDYYKMVKSKMRRSPYFDCGAGI